MQKVTSWVEEDLAPHTLPDDAEWGAEPRSYIGCLSEVRVRRVLTSS